MKHLILALALALAGCANMPGGGTVQVGQSPEAQIKAGADTVKAAALTAEKLLANHVISVNTARGYSKMLHGAGDALDDANADLVKCRKDTGSNEKTAPDPCWPKVADVVTIALQNITAIRQALPK